MTCCQHPHRGSRPSGTPPRPTAHESPAGTVDAEMKTLLSAAEKSLESHAMAAERMGVWDEWVRLLEGCHCVL